MKIGLIALTLLLANSALAGSCESAGISYGKDPEWSFTHASYTNVRKISEAQKGGCNFNAKAKCVNMKTRVSALSCAIILLDGEYETDYALTALLIKNKASSDELNLCQYKHKVVEGMFFATRAMSDSDSKDKNLKQLSDKLYLLSSETGYNERCLYASKDSKNPGSQGSLGVEANK